MVPPLPTAAPTAAPSRAALAQAADDECDSPFRYGLDACQRACGGGDGAIVDPRGPGWALHRGPHARRAHPLPSPPPPSRRSETWTVTSPRAKAAASGTPRASLPGAPRAPVRGKAASARFWAKAVAAVSGKPVQPKAARASSLARQRSAGADEAGDTAARLRAVWRLRESVEAAVWDDGRTPRGDVFPSPFWGRGWRRLRGGGVRGRTPDAAPRGGGVAAVGDSPQRVHGGGGGPLRPRNPSTTPSLRPALLAAAACALAAAHAPRLAAALVPASPLAAAMTLLAVGLVLASGVPGWGVAAATRVASAARAGAAGLDQVCATVDGLGLLPLLILRVEGELAAARADIGAIRRKVDWLPDRTPRAAGAAPLAGD